MGAEPHADLVFRVAAQPEATAPRANPPLVNVSWRRCLEQFHLDPVRRDAPLVLDGHRVSALREQHDDLLEIAQLEIAALYDQIATSGYALLLADSCGVILSERVDPAIEQLFDQAGLLIGAEWSERREGTNGIGTCAAEGRPITIHQDDHFRSQHIALSCSAAPIHDPTGRVIAVLDASCVNASGSREAQMHTVALVNTSARRIERRLFLRRHPRDTVLRFHEHAGLLGSVHDGSIAVSDAGLIVAADRSGLRLLGAREAGEVIGRPFSDLFDAPFDALKARASGNPRSVWPLRDVLRDREYFASVSPDALPLPAIEPRTRTRPAARQIAPSPRPTPSPTLEELAGEDPQMIRHAYNARRIVNSDVAVLITGPTGAGKEAFARAMHQISRRADHPFVALNCAAIPETLIESELFGYAPGAFTGARREGMRGLIAHSSGGTLFLDEIGDMPLTLQTRLLRVLESREVTPLSSTRAMPVDLHVIAATNRKLRERVAAGTFREDLYFRINGVTFDLPALAMRGDKEALIRRCIAQEAADGEPVAIELEALEVLNQYAWPGNVRELRNTIRTALALCERRLIRRGDLPPEMYTNERPRPEDQAPAADPRAVGSATALALAERQTLLEVIKRNAWNMTQVASELRLSRNTLYRKLREHGIAVGAGRYQQQ